MSNQDTIVMAVDLLQQSSTASGSGPQWAHECEDLDITLLSWAPGKNIAAHVNNEVDVVLIGVSGNGTVTVEDETHPLRQGTLLLIPKGKARAMQCGAEQWSYLSLHRRRRGLMPTVGGRPLP
ncbi:MAG TPA: cupin domain-containing protein [Abditibacteriaceae bacterium]